MGLIPAHAGKTEHATPRRPAHGAHPRSRGENAELGFQKVGGSGSSPLTRGKQTRWPHAIRGRRLIPAHAGKTVARTRGIEVPGAHPRSRGENVVSLITGLYDMGSSPLTRGKPLMTLTLTAAGGLIPAHAGKTCRDAMSRSISWAHPRSRGENPIRDASRAVLMGSSPLTRGKPMTWTPGGWPQGLIPAHAGKTRDSRAMWPGPTAHPRSRGENYADQAVGPFRGGSSPLTRGKRARQRFAASARRLIPAHAGKTTL